MTARQHRAQMESLASMGEQLNSPLFWVDKISPGNRAQEIIGSLPISLASGQNYGLSLQGGTLIISGAQFGIHSYRITGPHASVASVEGTEQGIVISLFAGNGINQILLLNSPQPIPRHATNHSSISAPLELLDEYAQLRLKEETRELTATEQTRKVTLLNEIGSEYRRLNYESDRSSYRSTPSTSGESRSGGSSGRAG